MKKFFRAFVFAYNGVITSFKERNIKFHFTAATIVKLTGLFFHLSRTEWFVILILIGIIIALEMINTSLEEIANITRDQLNLDYSSTKRTRDVSAGAVLVMSIIALIIGVMIFVQKIL